MLVGNPPVDRPRRSGKTSDVIRKANRAADEGKTVYIIVRNLKFAESFSWLLRKGIGVYSREEVRQGDMIGLPVGLIFSDEIPYKDVVWMLQSHLSDHEYGGGYFTP